MGRRNKLKKFKEFSEFSNSVEFSSDMGFVKDQLRKFVKNKDVVLEIGCGTGDFSVEMARRFPDKRFIGVDIQGERLWVAAKDGLEEKLDNLLLFRCPVERIGEFLPKKSVLDIWITFPDPHPKTRNEKKRLTSPKFIHLYQQLLKLNGNINLKTDSELMYEYTLEIIDGLGLKLVEKIDDIYSSNLPEDHILKIQTRFERKWLGMGKRISWVNFDLYGFIKIGA